MKNQTSTLLHTFSTAPAHDKRPGPGSAGQSGDTQGLSDIEESTSESVRELVEDGQFLEAEIVSGIENAPDADQGEVRTRQVPDEDVPDEYLGKESDL